jgi:hypothetical protein
MTDLVAFVRACLDDDERVARAATPGPWRLDAGLRLPEQIDVVSVDYFTVCEDLEDTDAVHIARHDPVRVLADIKAKRAILELHDGEHYCPELKTGVYPHDWPSAAPWGSAGEAWRHASSEHFEGPCPTLRLLAQPFAGKEGFREEWRA